METAVHRSEQYIDMFCDHLEGFMGIYIYSLA